MYTNPCLERWVLNFRNSKTNWEVLINSCSILKMSIEFLMCRTSCTVENLINFNRLKYTSGKLKLIVLQIMEN